MFGRFRKRVKELISYAGLDYVGKFKDGTMIYTYKADDLHNINYRYYENVQEILNALMLFKLGKSEANVFFNTVLDMVKNAIDAPEIRKKNEALVEIQRRVEAIKFSQQNSISLTNKEFELMYCAFFVIDGEEPFGYNKAMNERKIKLLNENQEMKDFFLSTLYRNLKVYQTSLEQSFIDVLKVMEGKANDLKLLITQEN